MPTLVNIEDGYLIKFVLPDSYRSLPYVPPLHKEIPMNLDIAIYRNISQNCDKLFRGVF